MPTSKAVSTLVPFVNLLLQEETNHDLEETLSTDQREGLQK